MGSSRDEAIHHPSVRRGREGYQGHLGITAAENEAKNSPLPGLKNGPADAYRHIIGAAELTRRYGESAARMMLKGHEVQGSLGTQKTDEREMDEHNNEIGIAIGKQANSFQEIVELARYEIDWAVRKGGIGEGDTAKWLDESTWSVDPRITKMPPDWSKVGPPKGYERGGPERRYRGFRDQRGDLIDIPVEEWTDEDRRAAHSHPAYWDRNHPDHKKLQQMTRAAYVLRYNDGGGEVQVRAHERDGGKTHVDAYTRRAAAR